MIWIPEKYYKMLPWFCIIIASIALFLPHNIVKYGCCLYLYSYAVFILLKRWSYARY